jgi:hypothetical protein
MHSHLCVNGEPCYSLFFEEFYKSANSGMCFFNCCGRLLIAVFELLGLKKYFGTFNIAVCDAFDLSRKVSV